MREHPIDPTICSSWLRPCFYRKEKATHFQQLHKPEDDRYYIFPTMIEEREGTPCREKDVLVEDEDWAVNRHLVENASDILRVMQEQTYTVRIRGEVHKIVGESVKLNGRSPAQKQGSPKRLIRHVPSKYTLQPKLKSNKPNRKLEITRQLNEIIQATDPKKRIISVNEGPALEADFSANQICKKRREWVADIIAATNLDLLESSDPRTVASIKTVFTDLTYIPRPLTLIILK